MCTNVYQIIGGNVTELSLGLFWTRSHCTNCMELNWRSQFRTGSVQFVWRKRALWTHRVTMAHLRRVGLWKGKKKRKHGEGQRAACKPLDGSGPWLPPPIRSILFVVVCLSVCLFACLLATLPLCKTCPNGFAWNFQRMSAMGQWTNE